jgi:hypothetical protein
MDWTLEEWASNLAICFEQFLTLSIHLSRSKYQKKKRYYYMRSGGITTRISHIQFSIFGNILLAKSSIATIKVGKRSKTKEFSTFVKYTPQPKHPNF